jgi:hypothetical protein
MYGVSKKEEVPYELFYMALMWQGIMDKAMPALRKIYAQRAKQQDTERDYME